MIHDAMWLVTIAALWGVVLNIRRQRVCFIVWGVTNALWVVYDAWIGAWPQAALFWVYYCTCFWGWHVWGRDE